MAPYHKDIAEYFVCPTNPVGNQISIASAYTSIVSSLNSYLTSSPEKSVAMRKLLESFDAAMRAAA